MSSRWSVCISALAFISAACSSSSPGDGGHDGPPADAGTAPSDAGGTDAMPDPLTQFTWDFEQQTVGADAPGGTHVADTSGSGLDGTTEGTLTWVRGELTQAVGATAGASGAVVLDGARAAKVADVAADESFRLEVGFRTDVHGNGGEDGGGTLVAREADGEAGFRLSVEDGHVRFRVWSAGGTPSVVTSGRLVSDDRWHRVAVVRDSTSTELVLILDGTGIDRKPDASGALASTAPIAAFRGGTTPRPFVGSLDSVRFVRARGDAPKAAPERGATQVFLANHEPVPGGGGQLYAGFRIPAIVRTSEGTLLAFAEGRVDGLCDNTNIDIVMKRSTDGGATWSPLVRVFDAGPDKAGNPVPIVDGTRVVLLVTTDKLDQATCKPNKCCETASDPQRVSFLSSDDDGATWTTPLDVTTSVALSSWSQILLGPGHGIRLEHGPNTGSLALAAMHNRASDGKSGGHLLVSSNGGATWRIEANETDSPIFHFGEFSLAEGADGSLLANARVNINVTDAERQAGMRVVASMSPDFMYTSSPPFSRTTQFRGPAVAGALLAREGSFRLGDDRRTLFSFPAGEHGTFSGQRHDLRVYTSRNDGTSWGPGKRVVGPWAAYSDLVALDGASVGVLHEAGILPTPTSFQGYQRLDFVRFGVDWLDERTLVSYTFEDRAPGDAFGSPSGWGGVSMPLTTTGTVTFVDGRHSSTAAHFNGMSRACTTAASVAGWLDFDRRDSFAVEATFRTTAHATGGSLAAGTLLSRTVVGSEPAWWVRVDDGKIRFDVASCSAGAAQDVDCGVKPGACAGIAPCTEAGVYGGPTVSDGAWHHVRAVRDAVAGQLVLEVDGVQVGQTAYPAGGIVTNEQPLCVGAFADGNRAFKGDIDGVRVELVD
jgi:sialidase-1